MASTPDKPAIFARTEDKYTLELRGPGIFASIEIDYTRTGEINKLEASLDYIIDTLIGARTSTARHTGNKPVHRRIGGKK